MYVRIQLVNIYIYIYFSFFFMCRSLWVGCCGLVVVVSCWDYMTVAMSWPVILLIVDGLLWAMILNFFSFTAVGGLE